MCPDATTICALEGIKRKESKIFVGIFSWILKDFWYNYFVTTSSVRFEKNQVLCFLVVIKDILSAGFISLPTVSEDPVYPSPILLISVGGVTICVAQYFAKYGPWLLTFENSGKE